MSKQVPGWRIPSPTFSHTPIPQADTALLWFNPWPTSSIQAPTSHFSGREYSFKEKLAEGFP